MYIIVYYNYLVSKGLTVREAYNFYEHVALKV